MPKKSEHYGWSCSECYPDSSDSNAELSNVLEDDLECGSDAATQKRNRKRRLAASKGTLNYISCFKRIGTLWLFCYSPLRYIDFDLKQTNAYYPFSSNCQFSSK